MLNQIETDTNVIRIVIVEDYKLTRIGLCAILGANKGIKVVGDTDNAEKGVELVLSLRPDLVLMDLSLPGITGIEATQCIKACDDSIKVIIYTSHGGEQEVVAALGAGADAYCVKDKNPNNLIETIRTVAEGAAWLDPEIASIALDIFRKTHFPTAAFSNEHTNMRYATLTEREQEVLMLLVEGLSNTEIAEKLVISIYTVKEHVSHILQKLSVNDRVQAAVKAIRDGIV